eukprot:5395921-Prymnesium_polylepis.1
MAGIGTYAKTAAAKGFASTGREQASGTPGAKTAGCSGRPMADGWPMMSPGGGIERSIRSSGARVVGGGT